MENTFFYMDLKFKLNLKFKCKFKSELELVQEIERATRKVRQRVGSNQ